MIQKIKTHIKQNPLKYKVAAIITMAAAGLTISALLMNAGSNLIIESGASEETIKSTVGVVFLSYGLFMSVYFLVQPVSKLFAVWYRGVKQ